MLKFLNNNEKLASKDLWQNIFTEDSKNFVDYYYSVKTKDNIVLGKFINEELVSMLHLNPYTISFNNKNTVSYYIVGVATLENHRKKGYMRELLVKSLNNMYKENIPFTFLMPAKEEIYLPFDFTYIYNHSFLEFKENLNLKKVPVSSSSDYLEASLFLNKNFKYKYNVFTVRDVNYIKTLQAELKSENGNFLKVYLNNNFIGYYLYWGENKDVRSIYAPNNYTKVIKTEPKIMARIVNLKSFLENINLSENTNLDLYFKIEDNIIKNNSNTFSWQVSNTYSKLEPCNNIKNSDIIFTNISSLTSFIFGYTSLEKLILENKITCENKDILNKLNLIKIMDKVFLDEVV